MIKIYLKWFLIVSAIAVLIVFLFNVSGELLKQELLQDVSIREEPVNPLPYGIKIGDKPPYWKLPNLDGELFSISDFSGKPLIITFWTSWNNLSTDQIKILDEYPESEKLNFKIISINSQEDKSAVFNFIQRGGYKTSVFLDQTGETGESYKIKTLPASYFIDKDGNLRDVFVGVMNKKTLEEKIQKIIR